MIEKIYLPFMKEERRIFIYLPENYCNSDERYPVMYFFDGHNLFSDNDATFGRAWRLSDYLDKNKKKLIVVGSECADNDRKRGIEYCPYNILSPYFGPLEGKGEDTFKWIINDVKTHIDSNYRTKAGRENTAIGGSSMGGLMSLYGIIKHNDVFSRSAAISPSVINTLECFTKDISNSNIEKDSYLFISFGTKENKSEHIMKLDDTISKLYGLLEEKGINITLYRHINGKHNEESWEKEIPLWMDCIWKEL